MISGGLLKTVHLDCMNTGRGRSFGILLFYFNLFLFPFDSEPFFAEATFLYSDTHEHKKHW